MNLLSKAASLALLGLMSMNAHGVLVISVDLADPTRVVFDSTLPVVNASTQCDPWVTGSGAPSAACSITDEHQFNDTAVFDFLSGDPVYKSEVPDNAGDPIVEEGSLAASYQTVYLSSMLEPSGADITYQPGTSFVDCSADCWMVVKDGDKSPARYLFNLALAGWDGTDQIALRNFWNGPGAISHVAIWGEVSPIPVPAAFWLFGTALLGFVGISRRTRV